MSAPGLGLLVPPALTKKRKRNINQRKRRRKRAKSVTSPAPVMGEEEDHFSQFDVDAAQQSASKAKKARSDKFFKNVDSNLALCSQKRKESALERSALDLELRRQLVVTGLQRVRQAPQAGGYHEQDEGFDLRADSATWECLSPALQH